MPQVPVPFPGLKWPCRYLQITVLSKAALSGVICQWPQGRKQGGGAKQKATDTSKPVKNVMVFVKDLASAVAVEEHHSWIRCFGSSGEMVNIKGLCRSLPFRRLLTGDLFMTFSKRRRNTWWSFFFESQDNPCLPGVGKNPHTQFQVNKFPVAIRAVQLARLYLSYRLLYDYLCRGVVIRPS